MQMMLRGTVVFTICLVISVTANVCRGAADRPTAEIGANAKGNVEIADGKINRRNDMLENAGRFIDPHTMVWMRKLDVPVARVWEAVSAKQGLEKWWIVRSVEIDLRPGGAFSHHWENTITDYKENEYIDFGGMRFELKADGETTVFSFIDNWAEDAVPGKTMLPEEEAAIDAHQPGGPGTPWSGVAGGWHGMIDALETYLTGKTFDNSWEDLCRFYAGYLTDHFRWQKLMAPKQERAKMTDVTQNIAVDSDGAGAETPKITEIVPVFGIASYDEAVAHYIDWLGFNLDWEWRAAPGRPVIMAISRDGVSLMLNEHPASSSASSLVLKVTDIYAFAEEWNARRPNSVTVAMEPPYDIPSIFVRDPFGNSMDFQQPVSAEEEEDRKRRAPLMRDYVRQRLAGGNACPTPQEVVDAIGRPLGLAIDVLSEFPEYEQATREDNPEPEERR